MATQCIGTVRGINHHPALPNNFSGLLDKTLLGVFLMNLKKLTHC
jgi:hypothetical protein